MIEEERREDAGDQAMLFPADAAGVELLLDEEFDRLYERLRREEEGASQVRWGGFFRRALAFLVDAGVLTLLSAVLFYIAYVGYSVGLAANHKSFSAENIGPFLFLLSPAWVSLVAGYFILLHGMEGKTIGKWLLGLKVVAADQEPITYRQAALRCAAGLLSFFSVIGVLWILFHREKRGWHDLIARTWVVREKRP